MPEIYVRARLLTLLALVAASAFAQKVTLEFDQTRDFSDLKTFQLRDGRLYSKNPSLNNDIVKRNIEAEIRARFVTRGLQEVAAQPDLIVRYSLGSGRRTEVDRYPAGWRGWGTRVVKTNYTEGTLVIDLNDARKHELIWRAIAVEEKSDPMKVQEHLADMVRKSVDKYPPKPK